MNTSTLKASGIILYPVMTERTVAMVESQNKLTFIVDRRSNKHSIKRAVEDLYAVKVSEVRTLITPAGAKKAFVTLAPESKASEVAVRLGIL